MGMSLFDVMAFVVVGAFWGCTNPLLREGTVGTPEETNEQEETSQEAQPLRSFLARVYSSLLKLRRVRVWLPYALNQLGSVLFNILLANHDLSTTVPACNGLALVFSVITSHAIGERVNKPGQAILGSILVIVGLGICMHADSMASEAENAGGIVTTSDEKSEL